MNYYDLAALMLVGFGHLYVYRQMTDYGRLSVPVMIGLSVLFMVFLGVSVTVTGYTELNGILLFLFLVGIGVLKGDVPISRNVLFALFSSAGLTLARLVGLEVAMSLYMASPWNLYIWTASILHMLVAALLIVAAVFGRRHITLFGRYAVSGPLFVVSYVLLSVSFAVVMLLTTPTSLVSASWYGQAAGISYVAAFVLFFILMLILLVSYQIIKDRMADREQRLLDAEMLEYIGKLEKINDDFISFRHDYLNILQMLEEGVRKRDLLLIEDVYMNTVSPTSEQLKLREYDLLKLSNIRVSEVKSVVGLKVMTAYRQGIEVMVDIPEPIDSFAMPTIEFVRALTILLDNAIEESVLSRDKQLQIALFDSPDVQYVIIRNSSREETADILQLYEKRYSRKGQERGIGLFSLKRIVDKTGHATLETSAADYLFSQQLLLKKKKDRS